ncbi:transcription initiation factor TFIID subunit 6 isoform X1 [Tanacetum coccineum]
MSPIICFRRVELNTGEVHAIDETHLLEETLRPRVEAIGGALDIVSMSDVKKRIVDAVADNQEAVAVITAIQEEILMEIGVGNYRSANQLLTEKGKNNNGKENRCENHMEMSAFGHNYTSLHTRLTTTLLKPFLDQKWSLTQHYGAVQGLAALGPNVEMRIVKKQNENLKKNMDDREGSCKCSKSSGPNWLGIKHLIDWSLLLRIILPELLSDPSPS